MIFASQLNLARSSGPKHWRAIRHVRIPGDRPNSPGEPVFLFADDRTLKHFLSLPANNRGHSSLEKQLEA